jgi:hypothetical protein
MLKSKAQPAWYRSQTCVFVTARMSDNTRAKLLSAMRRAERERRKEKEAAAWRKQHVLNA